MQDRTQQIVQRMIDAGESEEAIASVIRELSKPATSSPRKPADQESLSTKISAGADLAASTIPGGKFIRNLVRRENWPMLAGGAFALGTGGLGAVPAIGAAALGGMTGKAAQMMTDAVEGQEPESVGAMVSDIGIEGGKQGVIEGAGRGVVAGGRRLATGLMRRALGPTKAASMKYPNMLDDALDQRVLVSEGGAGKAQGIREAAQSTKVDAINNARPVSILTNPIKRGAADQTIDVAVGQQLAGMRPTMNPSPAVERFGGGRPGISLPESELAKKQLDNATTAAHQAQRMGKRPALGDAERMALAREILESQDAVVPGMRGMNRNISNAMGLEQAIKQRVAQPGSGLADEAALMGSLIDPRMALSRIVREPQALSALAILVNELKKTGKVAPTAVRSLLMTSRDK